MATNREEYIISLIDKGVTKGLQDITKDVQKLRSSMDGVQKNIGKQGGGGIAGALGGLGKLAGRIFVAKTIYDTGKAIFNLGTNMEQTRVAFATFLGDKGKADKLISELNEFANVTPFNNDEIIKSGRLLLSAGIGADDVANKLKMIGDVSAGANVPIEELSAIFQKATNKGKLQAEELNQFSERGIPILDTLATMYGKTKNEIMDMGSKGQITSDVMNQAFQQMTGEGGLFFNLMEKQSQTVGGRLSTLVGKMQTIGIAIGEKLLPVFGGIIDGILNVIEIVKLNIEKIKGVFAPIGEALQPLWESIAKVGETLGFVNEKGESTFGIVDVLSGVFTYLANIISTYVAPIINVLATVLGKALEIVAKLVNMFIEWVNKTEWVKRAMAGLISVVKGTFTRIKNVAMSILGGVGDLLVGIFTLDMDKIKSAMAQFGHAIKEGNPISTAKAMAEDFSKGYSEGLKLEKITLDDPNKKKNDEMAKTGSSVQGVGKGLPTTSSVTKSGLKAGISEVKASAPKTFNININSLIKEQNFETVKDMTEMKNIIRNEVSRLLLGVVNDVQTT